MGNYGVIVPQSRRAVKFCFTGGKMLKFSLKVFSLQELFPPLAGVRGWNLSNFVLFHPPAPASGGEISCKPSNFVQKINASKFAKIELNSPAQSRGDFPLPCDF